VTRHFKNLATAAGLPPIKLHEGRHTAATLRLEADVDIRVVSEQLGHANTHITQNLYQHVRRAVLDQATEAVIRLLPDTAEQSQAAG
jgi:integrase